MERSAARISRKEGSEDVARAVNLIQRGIGKRMSPTQRVAACCLMAEGMNAVIFCEIDGFEDQWEFFASFDIVEREGLFR